MRTSTGLIKVSIDMVWEPGQVHRDDNDEMRPEYDFSQGVRGKHYEAYRAGTNVVFLDPDVARVFSDSASVNQVLRLLLRLAKTNVRQRLGVTRRSSLGTAVNEGTNNRGQRRASEGKARAHMKSNVGATRRRQRPPAPKRKIA